MVSDWSAQEDLREGSDGAARKSASGAKFWALRCEVDYPVLAYTCVLLRESADGTLTIEHGRVWPMNETDDGA